MRLRRVAVLCSGEGTNLQAILDAVHRKRLRAEVVAVISDREDARALRRASTAGVPGIYLNPASYSSRKEYDQVLAGAIRKSGADWVVLAGFMRILSPWFVRTFRHRVLNVHPSLLPAFRGAHAVRDAFIYGAKWTGVTVHFVDERVDHGPVIAQEAVRITPSDTETSLLKRVHRVEHRLYPQVLQWAVSGRLKIRGRHVHISSRKQ